MAKHGIRSKSNETGLSLPEVLISLLIFAVVGVTFVSALGTNFKVLIMADQRTTAESLAKAQMEAINNAPYDSISPYTYSKITGIPAGYDISIYAVLVDPLTGGVSATDLGVQKVTCNVTYQLRQITVVESYKR